MSYTYTVNDICNNQIILSTNQSVYVTSSGSIDIHQSFCIATSGGNNHIINNAGVIIGGGILDPENNTGGVIQMYNSYVNTIINTGNIINTSGYSSVFDIYISSGGSITNLYNFQNGLTYYIDNYIITNSTIPQNYYTIIQQHNYGSINITNSSGLMTFNIDPSSNIDPTFIYTNIIVGVPYAQITPKDGTFNDNNWTLLPNLNGVANSYNLFFSPSVYNIAKTRFNDNIYTLTTNPTVLYYDITILPNQSLIIPKGFTLDISSNNGQIDNNGAIINYGTLIIDGVLNSNGIFNNEFGGSMIIPSGTININSGNFINRGNIDNGVDDVNDGTININNNSRFINNGKIKIDVNGFININNSGILDNNGTLDNYNEIYINAICNNNGLINNYVLINIDSPNVLVNIDPIHYFGVFNNQGVVGDMSFDDKGILNTGTSINYPPST